MEKKESWLQKIKGDVEHCRRTFRPEYVVEQNRASYYIAAVAMLETDVTLCYCDCSTDRNDKGRSIAQRLLNTIRDNMWNVEKISSATQELIEYLS